MAKKILITGSCLVPPSVFEYIESRGYVVKHVDQDTFSPEELHDALEGVSGYLIGGYEEPLAAHFDAARKLEAVAWVGTDYKAYVPGWRRAYELGIAFINSPGTNAISVAEFTFALLLAITRRLVDPAGAKPTDKPISPPPGTDLFGKQLGIIGLGRIGGHVAKIAGLGFGMKVLYTGPNRKPALEEALGVEFRTKDQLLKQSDIITLHRPGHADPDVPELDGKSLKKLKKGSILINTVRPDLVDLDSLYSLLKGDAIAGAAFDGTSKGDAWANLMNLPRTKFIAVPSMAYNTLDANYRASIATATAVCDVLDGKVNAAVNNAEFLTKRTQR